ncbi:MAG TPA: cation diffusion facilitator family transporter [Stellaceae bacterium]|nr:cation diffusion facilitator family transporter [Stellaceae bacterium]
MTAIGEARSFAEAARLMKRATYASVMVAAAMIAIKLGAWILTDSVSMLSSLLDSLLDAAASVLNLIAVRQAVTPADREHRFGHGKAEPLAGLGQAAFIGGSAVFLFIEAARHLVRPAPTLNTELGIGVMGLAIVLTMGLVLYQRYVIRHTGSLVVSADELHYRSDVILNASVIVSLAVSGFLGWPYADPLFGILIGIWIIWGAWLVTKKAIVQLMDRELPDEQRARIREIVLGHPEVAAVHELRTRAAGPMAFIQVHIEMDGNMSLAQAHRVSDEVEAALLQAFPRAEVIIHQDPAGVNEGHRAFPAASIHAR